MKRVYLVVPLLGLTAFAGYYQHWNERYEFMRGCPPCHASDVDADRNGMEDARRDLAAGKLVLLTYGERVGYENELNAILRTEYGIESNRIAGCEVTVREVSYAAFYNNIVMEEITRRHGPDVLRRAHERAQFLAEIERARP